ncbi:MAG: methylmalonyl-CoA mutase family protein, partial [Verrucomicrobiota bacterium]
MSTIPDFSSLNLEIPAATPDKSALNNAVWRTVEQIDVNSVYTDADLAGNKLVNYTAGIAPFLRGPYATMYVARPWTV